MKSRVLSIQQKSPVQIFGIFAGQMNASDRFPEFEVTCSATQGILGETLMCLKMADFSNIYAALEHDYCETISCTILTFARKTNTAVPLECA